MWFRLLVCLGIVFGGFAYFMQWKSLIRIELNLLVCLRYLLNQCDW